MSTRAFVYGVSLIVHAGIAAAVVGIRTPGVSTPVVITITSVEPPKPPPLLIPTKPPEPEPMRPVAPKAPPPPRVVKAAPPPPAAAAPAPTSAPAPEFGVELAGASGPGGIAVPVGDPTVSPTRKVAPPKELKVEPVIAHDACNEPASKPKPVQVSQPAFPEEARAAGIQGRVRVELTVDDSGAVVQVRLVEGLGHGLDEAALEAARTYRFEPALRCGKAVSATFTISIRFTI